MEITELFDGSKLFLHSKCQCCNNIDYISKLLLEHKCWEPNVSGIILEILKLKNDNIFFDIGSFIGYFGIISSKYCKKIYAFEADILNINLLNKSAEINGVNNINTINCCITNNEENSYKTSSATCKGNRGALRVEKCDRNNSNIKSLVLDNFISENGIQNIDLMKIDIEGSELECLNGLKNTLKTNIIKHIIIEVTPCWGIEESINILEILSNNNYLLYNAGLVEVGKIDQNNITLKNVPIIENINQFVHNCGIQTNVLAIKNI